ncbi:MAG: hypothetical protein ACJ8CB_21250 [Ktedonobacteraceae bacterium]
MSFLPTATVFLLLTNMISALLAFHAMKAAHSEAQPQRTLISRIRCLWK